MEQQATNVWRKRAFSAIKSAQDQFGKDVQGSDRLLGCLDTFRERVDHNVENTVPAGLVRINSCKRDEICLCFFCCLYFIVQWMVKNGEGRPKRREHGARGLGEEELVAERIISTCV